MVDRIARWKFWAAGLAAYAAVALCLMPAPEARPEEKKGEKPADKALPPTKATRLYYGAKSCREGCHEGAKPPGWTKDPLCRCDEYTRWMTEDKHTLAYAALTSDRGKQMTKLLGYDVTKAKACLTCHAVWIEDKKQQHTTFDIKEGVSCVACHGEYQEWVEKHSGPFSGPKFRAIKDRNAKWVEAGMRDLWDPHARAELCASCHVGNPEQGKFVTHDMYAAGHPTLPSFELATFSNEMPRHWQYLREKKSKDVRTELGFKDGEQEETKLVLVGAVVSLKQTMQLMVDDVKKRKSLDLAHFDCAACHHDLKADSWRQKRGYGGGRPGRVPMRYWSPELVRLAIEALPEADAKKMRAEFKDLLDKVEKAFDDQAEHGPGVVKAAAEKLATFADGLAKRLNRETYKADETKKLLGRFEGLFFNKGRLLDFDSTRQVVWAYEAMHDEIVDPSRTKMEKERFAGKEAKLAKALELRLSKKGEYMDALKRVMKARNDYDPTRDGKGLPSKLKWPAGD